MCYCCWLKTGELEPQLFNWTNPGEQHLLFASSNSTPRNHRPRRVYAAVHRENVHLPGLVNRKPILKYNANIGYLVVQQSHRFYSPKAILHIARIRLAGRILRPPHTYPSLKPRLKPVGHASSHKPSLTGTISLPSGVLRTEWCCREVTRLRTSRGFAER